MNAQNNSYENQTLDVRQRQIVIISSFTAKGDFSAQAGRESGTFLTLIIKLK